LTPEQVNAREEAFQSAQRKAQLKQWNAMNSKDLAKFAFDTALNIEQSKQNKD
jgi:hypothetical protein